MPFKALIVEDDIEQARELIELLSGAGFDVSYAEDGVEAIATIISDNPKLVLLDINLPGYDGLRVIEIVRNLNFNGRVIAFSGNTEALSRARTERDDFVFVLEKPLQPKNIEALLADFGDRP